MKKLAPKRTESDFIQSASVTAMMRALLSEKNEFQNPDYLAKYFVSHPWSEFLKDREIYRKLRRKSTRLYLLSFS